MDPSAVAAQLGAETAAADELSLRLEVLAVVVASGAHHLSIDLVTRDVALSTARLQAEETQRLLLTGNTSLLDLVGEMPVERRVEIEAAARRVRRAAHGVEVAAGRARSCLAARMGTVDGVLAALDVCLDYDETGRRRLVSPIGRGASA